MRLRARGDEVATWVVDVAPTASVRRRAARLAELVARTSNDGEGPIHLVGHSTGGVDARLVASPDVHLPCDGDALAWLPRLASVTTLSTPHHGTPLASFFATVSGQRMLYALSALTVIALTLGSPPLAAASALVMAIGRIDHALGLDLRVLDRATESLLRVFDDARSREVRAYLDEIREDQGAMVQLMPEAMELYQASVRDRAGRRLPVHGVDGAAAVADELGARHHAARGARCRRPSSRPSGASLRASTSAIRAPTRTRGTPRRCSRAPSDGRPGRAPTTAWSRCGRSSTGASCGPARPTTSTCWVTSTAAGARPRRAGARRLAAQRGQVRPPTASRR